jgi:hypothetical protein
MKVVLYPLMGILHVSSLTFFMLSAQPETAALAAGIVVGAGIGLVYLAPLGYALLSAGHRTCGKETRRKVRRLFAVGFVASLAVFAIGEILYIPVLMTVSSVAIVLSTLSAGSGVSACEAVGLRRTHSLLRR